MKQKLINILVFFSTAPFRRFRRGRYVSLSGRISSLGGIGDERHNDQTAHVDTEGGGGGGHSVDHRFGHHVKIYLYYFGLKNGFLFHHYNSLGI
jgi:hypothetical protein